MSNKERAILIIVICAILAVLMIILTPIGRSMWNKRMHDVQVADDSTNYETLKKVEDACRAMIASYESDRLTYEQYRDSDDSEERSWATQARMRQTELHRLIIIIFSKTRMSGQTIFQKTSMLNLII